MPIYKYKCLNETCNHEFESLLLGSEKEEDIKCPKCGNENKEKQIGATSHQINGASYKNGYSGSRRRR